MSELDRIVAFDNGGPTYFGWHVGREAMYLLEQIYWNLLMGTDDGEGEESHWSGGMWLISPSPEYATFAEQCRQMQPDGSYRLTLPPPPTLRVDPMWLAEKLRETWPNAALNVRQPRPQAYLLDWQLNVEGQTLIGGLHRDGYGVVIAGEGNSEFYFAAWYCGIISPEQPLFLYDWADYGTPLHPGMTGAEVEQAVRLENERHTVK